MAGINFALQPPMSPAERFKLPLSAIVWFILIIGLLISLPILLDIGWRALAIVAVLALALGLPVAWLVRRIFARQRWQSRHSSYVKASVAMLAVLAFVVAAPVYGLASFTALRPMTVPNATLSNGSKTVVFQGMTHVGSEGFYKSVVYDLEDALANGYELYYEGVMPSPDGDKWFDHTLAGGGDLDANYQQLGDACGLQFQLNYFGLLQVDRKEHPARHVSADVTTADMMHEYERLMQTDSVFATAMAKANAPALKGSSDGGGVDGETV